VESRSNRFRVLREDATNTACHNTLLENDLPRVVTRGVEEGNDLMVSVLATITLIRPTYEVEVFECSSGQLNALDRDLDPVDCRSVQQDGSNESEIDCKGCRSSALRGSFPSELDQFLAGDVFENH
jgi:hypothetical protein